MLGLRRASGKMSPGQDRDDMGVAGRSTSEQIVPMQTPPMRRSVVAIGLLIAAAPLGAQLSSGPRLARTKAAVDRIRAEDILRDVSYLASDANMGRRTPFPGLASPGYDSAAAYVARFLASMHVRPMGDNGTYFQHYTVTRSTLDTTRVAGAIGNAPLVYGTDFLIQSFLVPGVREADVIYVGSGIRRPKANVDPYAGFDIKGKWLLVSGSPAAFAGRRAPRPNPALGTISPVDFIPLAEKTGLIVPLGEWILREACSRLRAWQDDLPQSADVWISVNLSAVQLKDPALVQRVGTALRDSGLHPRNLMLELTESTAMENPTGIKSLLMQLRSTGVRISVDDFGTGYSSLAHLRQFPIDTLKIDRSFVRGIETRQDSAAIVGTLTDMARQLALEVVAEGIENEQQLTLLRSLRCHAAQGFLFARPLDEDKAMEMLRRGLARPTMPTAAPRRPLALLPSATWPWAACIAIVLLTVGFLLSPVGSVVPTALPAVAPPPPPQAVKTDAANTNPVPWTPVVPAQSSRGRTGENVATNLTALATTPDGRTTSLPSPPANVPALPKSSTSGITPAPPAPPEPRPVRVQNLPLATDALSVRVTHDHRVGHCEGQLIVSRSGISYVPDDTTSKDAFDFKYNDFVHLFQDDTLTIKSNMRTYRFRAEDKGRGPTLADFESRLARMR